MNDGMSNVLFASQSSIDELSNAGIEKENATPDLFPSPPRSRDSQKVRRPPTVTPKRFSRFFAPRPSLDSGRNRHSKSGRQLRDITRHAINNRPVQQECFLSKDFESPQPAKRRRYAENLSSSPLRSSPIKVQQHSPLKQQYVYEDDNELDLSEDEVELPVFKDDSILPVQRLRESTTTYQLLTRSFDGRSACKQRYNGSHNSNTLASTAGYCTRPHDSINWHQTGSSLAFCTSACNTNPLVAVGSEDGMVHMVDTASGADFSKPHVSFRVHRNAIMDLSFSPCDYILATASGDQTCRIVDMVSQQILSVLAGHSSSVKQIRFRSDDNKLLTTSGRDGMINVWDLRCSQRAVQALYTGPAEDDRHPLPTHLRPYASMAAGPAHRARSTNDKIVRMYQDNINAVGGVSITSIEHLKGSRSHLLLSASESNASLKLWDLRVAGRNTKSDRFGYEVPVSCTPEPTSQQRRYGVSALLLSTDGSRAYSVCKDSTIWVYSTQHLIMGSAPESVNYSKRTRLSPPERAKEGLGPLYGLRNSSAQISNFYIRAALRKTTPEHGELLAVGSQENCAVIFNTDERTLRQHETEATGRGISKPQWSSDATSDAPAIFSNVGTPLVRGHTKEITTLAFAHGGELVTNGDDYTARCWREDASLARHLRQCGEGEGLRWSSGWADVPAEYDEEEC